MPNTLSELIESYRTDRQSSFLKLNHGVRVRHERLLSQITREHGACSLKKIRSRDLLVWHEGWLGNGKIAKAHSLISRLRVIFRFGAIILEDKECRRLSDALSEMQFERSTTRSIALTAEQAELVRTSAREHFGWYSIALAQAFQFELRLNRKAVIGEWVPAGQAGAGSVRRTVEGLEQSWHGGLLWSDIDEEIILHSVDRRGRERRFDLKGAPMIMKELAVYADTSVDRLTRANLPDQGPLVICDINGLPWSPAEFRRKWRLVATQAGIPKNVMNMDSGKVARGLR
ncbi:hypothetical protein M2189_004289 [Bradyrhizobium japonicum]|uniref:hypothetical protein n=1 Tax=Bradyrhizobium japonicum TaxID=375 RepID=UPI00216844FE|nr:hypothetical protein [Bradyrhizobium japonicum]MCS3496752.1 hypothetical protein [Bradyrhizobium japonicum]MCS3961086.1 hypothetical protein [Bradyrhizobium japonicum]MCS4002840.1 hypothetical protein [Bradyrhizobium japonicum]